jgi:hypothetical protein
MDSPNNKINDIRAWVELKLQEITEQEEFTHKNATLLTNCQKLMEPMEASMNILKGFLNDVRKELDGGTSDYFPNLEKTAFELEIQFQQHFSKMAAIEDSRTQIFKDGLQLKNPTPKFSKLDPKIQNQDLRATVVIKQVSTINGHGEPKNSLTKECPDSDKTHPDSSDFKPLSQHTAYPYEILIDNDKPIKESAKVNASLDDTGYQPEYNENLNDNNKTLESNLNSVNTIQQPSNDIKPADLDSLKGHPISSNKLQDVSTTTKMVNKDVKGTVQSGLIPLKIEEPSKIMVGNLKTKVEYERCEPLVTYKVDILHGSVTKGKSSELEEHVRSFIGQRLATQESIERAIMRVDRKNIYLSYQSKIKNFRSEILSGKLNLDEFHKYGTNPMVAETDGLFESPPIFELEKPFHLIGNALDKDTPGTDKEKFDEIDRVMIVVEVKMETFSASSRTYKKKCRLDLLLSKEVQSDDEANEAYELKKEIILDRLWKMDETICKMLKTRTVAFPIQVMMVSNGEPPSADDEDLISYVSQRWFNISESKEIIFCSTYHVHGPCLTYMLNEKSQANYKNLEEENGNLKRKLEEHDQRAKKENELKENKESNNQKNQKPLNTSSKAFQIKMN